MTPPTSSSRTIVYSPASFRRSRIEARRRRTAWPCGLSFGGALHFRWKSAAPVSTTRVSGTSFASRLVRIRRPFWNPPGRRRSCPACSGILSVRRNDRQRLFLKSNRTRWECSESRPRIPSAPMSPRSSSAASTFRTCFAATSSTGNVCSLDLRNAGHAMKRPRASRSSRRSIAPARDEIAVRSAPVSTRKR